MKPNTQAIVQAILNGDDARAASLFESTMRGVSAFNVNDMKFAMGSTLFESAELNVPATHDYKIYAVDTSKKNERTPDGEPVSFTTSAMSHEGAAKKASGNNPALKIQKVISPEGEERLFEGTISMRLVKTHVGQNGYSAKVYKDSDWGEFRVKYFKDGKHLGEKADYHTDDKDDAHDTAQSQLERYAKVQNEDVDAKFGEFKNKIIADNPQHQVRFLSKPDSPDHIVAQVKGKDQTLGMFNHKTGACDYLGEGTETGGIESQIAADQQAENAAAQEASKRKSPSLTDVVSVLGNTVAVTDQQAAQ